MKKRTLPGIRTEIAHRRRAWSSAVMLAAVATMAGCASSPPRGEIATVAIASVVSLADWQGGALKPAERKDVQAAGLRDADMAAGRLVRVHCAMMTDGWWAGLAVLPPGMQVTRGTVVRMRLDDAGDNHREGLNTVVGPVPALSSGQPAYRFIPDWKERGLSNNFERVPLAPEQAGRYLVVQGSYLIKCRP